MAVRSISEFNDHDEEYVASSVVPRAKRNADVFVTFPIEPRRADCVDAGAG